MSITVLSNTGILGNDPLDQLRGQALVASGDGLPEALVYYLRALEGAYIDLRHVQKRKSLRDIGWKFNEGHQHP